MFKKLKGWKTFIVSILTVAFGAVASYDYTLMVASFSNTPLNSPLLGYLAAAAGYLAANLPQLAAIKGARGDAFLVSERRPEIFTPYIPMRR